MLKMHDNMTSLEQLTLQKLFVILFFTLVWWVCVWNLVEELVHFCAGGMRRRRIFIYIGITSFLILLMAIDPELLSHV